MKPLRTAVIPAAGLGTRFLPATKAQPKEMLTVVDKPAVQYAVEEAVAAGLDDVLIVISSNKRSIEDHFGPAAHLEERLAATGKEALAGEVRAVSSLATVTYVVQHEPLGLGHAVSLARDHVGDAPFAVMLPDDLMSPGSPALASMVELHHRTGASVVALREVSRDAVSSYGVVRPEPYAEGVVRVRGLVEKPPAATAPSNLAVIGRYVLTPAIFAMLETTAPGRGGEIQLTDAMARLLASEDMLGYVLTNGHYDIGDKLGFLKATVELALQRPDLAPDFHEYLVALVGRQEPGHPVR